MKLSNLTWVFALLLALLQGCSSDSDQASEALEAGPPQLMGTVHFEAEPTLIPGRTLIVTLVDITDGEEDPVTLSSTQTGQGTTTPYQFSLVYDPNLIKDGRQYRVMAELIGGPLPPKKSLTAVDPFAGQELVLAFERPKPKPTVIPITISLQGFKWYLSSLGGEELDLALEQRPYIEVDPKEDRFSGFAGCNRFTGGYTLNGTSLDLGQAAVTRMACEDSMQLEDQFLAMLGKVGSWRLKDGQMVLGDENREILATFRLEEQFQ